MQLAVPEANTVANIQVIKLDRVTMVDFFWYSVMHSQSNSFWGNVILDNVNMAYRDEDSTLTQRYNEQIFPGFYYKDLKL